MLLNPTDQSLEAAIYFGGQEQVLNEKNYFSYAITLTLFMSLLGIGIALAIAGMVIIILDKRRTDKMKQFGDTSDLI
jgi:asparagine N-glycosylation enzyme membrane subunit Stt3